MFGCTETGGFVLKSMTGMYLRYTEHTTHTGAHKRSEWKANIAEATIFHGDVYKVRKGVAPAAKIVSVKAVITVAEVGDDEPAH